MLLFHVCRPKVKTPPQDILLKLAKEQTYKELSQESSMFVFKLGLNKLQCCLLMNGLVFDSSEVILIFSVALHTCTWAAFNTLS
jgi:hypothetical protein